MEKDLEECITYLRFPSEHHKRIGTTNRLERLQEEGRRRTKVIRKTLHRRSLDAVHAALTRDETARAARAERAVIQKRFERLTPREREVMALVVQGLLNKQIGAELGAAERTIKVHRGR